MFQDISKKSRYLFSFARKKQVHVNLQILYSCNFKCEICDFWKEPYIKMRRLSVPQAQVIAEKLKPLGPQIISLGGGEPLMHKELVDIIKILSKDNFVAMICNGWYVTPEIARAIFQAGMYEISISVDYADPAKHDKQRGKKGAFDRATKALKTLHENRVHPHQRVHMISVVMDDNLDDIEPMIQLAEEIGVTYLVTFYSTNRGKKATKVFDKDISDYLLSLQKKHRNFVSIPGYLAQFSNAAQSDTGVRPCYAGKNLLNIDCQGDVTLCIDHLDNPAGNIFTDELPTLKKKLLEQHRQNDCGDCWTSCRGNIEPLMYGKQRWRDLWQSYQITKSVPLVSH